MMKMVETDADKCSIGDMICGYRRGFNVVV